MANEKPLVLFAGGNIELIKQLVKSNYFKQNYLSVDREATSRESLLDTIKDVRPNKVVIFDSLPSQFKEEDRQMSLTVMFNNLMESPLINPEDVIIVTLRDPGNTILTHLVHIGFYNIICVNRNLTKDKKGFDADSIWKLINNPNHSRDVEYLMPHVEFKDNDAVQQYSIPEVKNTGEEKVVFISKDSDHTDQGKDANKLMQNPNFNLENIKKHQPKAGEDYDAAKVAHQMGKRVDTAQDLPNFLKGKARGSVEIANTKVSTNNPQTNAQPSSTPADLNSVYKLKDGLALNFKVVG